MIINETDVIDIIHKTLLNNNDVLIHATFMCMLFNKISQDETN